MVAFEHLQVESAGRDGPPGEQLVRVDQWVVLPAERGDRHIQDRRADRAERLVEREVGAQRGQERLQQPTFGQDFGRRPVQQPQPGDEVLLRQRVHARQPGPQVRGGAAGDEQPHRPGQARLGEAAQREGVGNARAHAVSEQGEGPPVQRVQRLQRLDQRLHQLDRGPGRGFVPPALPARQQHRAQGDAGAERVQPGAVEPGAAAGVRQADQPDRTGAVGAFDPRHAAASFSTTQALNPPNPKLVDRAVGTATSTASAPTNRQPVSIGSRRPTLGWTKPSRIWTTVATASTTPAAPRQCPVMPLVALSQGRPECGPNTRRSASSSVRSPSREPEP